MTHANHPDTERRLDTAAVVAAWAEAANAFIRARSATMSALCAARTREELAALEPLKKAIQKNSNLAAILWRQADAAHQQIHGGER